MHTPFVSPVITSGSVSQEANGLRRSAAHIPSAEDTNFRGKCMMPMNLHKGKRTQVNILSLTQDKPRWRKEQLCRSSTHPSHEVTAAQSLERSSWYSAFLQ